MDWFQVGFWAPLRITNVLRFQFLTCSGWNHFLWAAGHSTNLIPPFLWPDLQIGVSLQRAFLKVCLSRLSACVIFSLKFYWSFFCFCVALGMLCSFSYYTTFLDHKQSGEWCVGFQMFERPILSGNENIFWSSSDIVGWPTIGGMTLLVSGNSLLSNFSTKLSIVLYMKDSFSWIPLVKQEYSFCGDVVASWNILIKTLLYSSDFSSV